MRKKFIVGIVFFSISGTLLFGQVTEGEKNLRTESADTTQGWKYGGVFAINLAQTSLTNWSAGDKIQLQSMAFQVFLPILKRENQSGIIRSILAMES